MGSQREEEVPEPEMRERGGLRDCELPLRRGALLSGVGLEPVHWEIKGRGVPTELMNLTCQEAQHWAT